MPLYPTQKPVWFTLHNAGKSTGHNPADSTTYYFGLYFLFDPGTTAGAQLVTLSRPCTLVKVNHVFIVGGTPGSAEDVTIVIRKNDTTNTTMGTVKYNASGSASFDTNLSFAAGDTFVIGISTPAWVTNPTALFYAFTLWWTSP